MKKITLKELWEDHLPDIVSFAVDTDISKKTDLQIPPEELEDDPYIQTLLALGHKVYIPVYKTDSTLIVVVA